jgi:hypothetical protein
MRYIVHTPDFGLNQRIEHDDFAKFLLKMLRVLRSGARLGFTARRLTGICRNFSVKREPADEAKFPAVRLQTKLFIDGEFADASSGKTFNTYNPANGSTMAKRISKLKHKTRPLGTRPLSPLPLPLPRRRSLLPLPLPLSLSSCAALSCLLC